MDDTDFFAEFAAREKKLFAQLAAASLVDVTGIVDPSGAAGAKDSGDQLWTLSFTFDTWRIGTEAVQTQPITVRRNVTDSEFDTFRDVIAPSTVIRIRARVVLESVFGDSQALLEEYVGVENSDPELNDHLVNLQKLVTHKDSTFGVFTLDRQFDWYEAETGWDGKPVRLSLSVEDPSSLDEALKVAHALWDTQTSWNQRIRDYAVQELLSLKNDAWLDEDEDDVTPEQFKERMDLESVTVYPDGSFEFWHDDGDLFWGHSIQISGSLSEGPTNSDIPG